jgi:uncharacterized protein (TIGR00297 family)
MDYLLPFGLIALAAWASVRARKLDVPGAWAGAAIASGLFLGGGYPALLLLGLFFLLGTAASRWGREAKEAQGLAEEHHGQRSWGNALGNGGAAGLCGWLALALPEWQGPLLLAAAGSLAGATADTLSSELGNLYGRRYWDLRTGKPGRRGEHGVVSLEGTLLGVAGAAVLAFASPYPATALLAAGLAGTLSDSLLGAWLERQGWAGNHAVNAMASAVAGAVALLWA